MNDPGDATIQRGNGRAEAARQYALVYPGDKLLVRGQNARVAISVRGQRDWVWLDPIRRPAFLARQPAPMGIGGRAIEFARRLLGIYDQEPILLAERTDGRGDPVTGARPPPPFAPAQASPQLVAPDATSIVPAWQGRATTLIVKDQNGRVVYDELVIGKGSAEIPIGRAATHWTVSIIAPEGKARFEIDRARRPPPGPPWLGEVAPGLNRDVLTAAWLATEGPEEWRLEGASRLARLGEQDFAALALWRGVANGLRPQRGRR